MKKKIFIIISCVLVFLVCNISLAGYFLFIHHYKGKNIVNEWSVADDFNITEIQTVQKQKNKDFVILNLADIQMCDLEDIFNMPTIHKEISHLVNTVKPDLITLTGDQTWSNENLISLKSLVRWLDGYKIPYAPVFGNHDYGNQKNSAVCDLNFCCHIYESGKYSLFKRGPSNLGTLGNYVINIMEDNKIYKTLYMLDSGYEEKITDMQIEWLNWNMEGLKQVNNGKYSSSMCFFHKPIPEFREAYYKYINNTGEVQAIGDVYVTYSLSGSLQNGLYNSIKDKNITDFVCGHQHGNMFTLNYNNINFTFALKTGELGGYYEDEDIYLNGATVFNLNNNTTTINNIFVDRNKFHIKN